MPELVRGRAPERDHLPRELYLRRIRAGRQGQLPGAFQECRVGLFTDSVHKVDFIRAAYERPKRINNLTEFHDNLRQVDTESHKFKVQIKGSKDFYNKAVYDFCVIP